MITLNTITKYKNLLENKLSPQERKVIVGLVRASNGNIFNTNSTLREKCRIFQANQFHTILGRLVKKEILVKIARGKYNFKNLELVEHIKYRCLRMM